MDDVVLVQQRAVAPELQVVAAQRGALVAGHEPGRAQPRLPVAAALVEREPHQCLDAGQVDTTFLTAVPVLEPEIHVRLLESATPTILLIGPEANRMIDRNVRASWSRGPLTGQTGGDRDRPPAPVRTGCLPNAITRSH